MFQATEDSFQTSMVVILISEEARTEERARERSPALAGAKRKERNDDTRTDIDQSLQDLS